MRERNEDGWQGMPDAKLIVEKDREKGDFVEFPLSFDPHKFKYDKFKTTK
jgi:hypothetical protein